MVSRKCTKKTYCTSKSDIDEYTYCDKNNILYEAKYKTHPSSILDVTYSQTLSKYEHPYESMSIELEL